MWYVYIMIISFVCISYIVYKDWQSGKDVLIEDIGIVALLTILWFLWLVFIASKLIDTRKSTIIKGKEKQ